MIGVVPRTICQLVHTLNVGGAEVLAREFSQRAGKGFRSVFACLDDLGPIGEQLRAAGFHVELLDRKPGIDVGCARRLAGFCRRHRVNLIHAHQNAPFFYATMARLMRSGASVLFTEHGRDYPDNPSLKRMVANRLLLRREDRVVAVGEAVREALVRNEGIPAGRIEVVYNGVNLSAYDPQRSQRAEVRRELGLDEGQTTVMQVARLNRLKDHPTALRAVAHLVRQYPNVRLLIVGEGEERPWIESLIDELDLGPHVRLLGLRNDIPRLLQAADVFLLTSITEGIPLTLIEAMASGLPCVSTRVGGTPEVIVDGETGVLAEASEPESVAAGLRTLFESTALRERMGEAGRRRACALFDEEAMHRAYGRLYREMLHGNGAVKGEVAEC